METGVIAPAGFVPPDDEQAVSRPSGYTPPPSGSVARLVLSDGQVVDVDRVVIVGRAPRARRPGDEHALLVTVPSPQQEISSTHVEFRPGTGADQGSPVVTDLGSTNGTVVVQPGLRPEDLHPGVAVQLNPGAVVDLGEGLTIQVAPAG
jgi:pSer/pThr/pTyr-binding forkhead associated (FHA) protein